VILLHLKGFELDHGPNKARSRTVLDPDGCGTAQGGGPGAARRAMRLKMVHDHLSRCISAAMTRRGKSKMRWKSARVASLDAAPAPSCGPAVLSAQRTLIKRVAMSSGMGDEANMR
jgi:hypothetical protein